MFKLFKLLLVKYFLSAEIFLQNVNVLHFKRFIDLTLVFE